MIKALLLLLTNPTPWLISRSCVARDKYLKTMHIEYTPSYGHTVRQQRLRVRQQRLRVRQQRLRRELWSRIFDGHAYEDVRVGQ